MNHLCHGEFFSLNGAMQYRCFADSSVISAAVSDGDECPSCGRKIDSVKVGAGAGVLKGRAEKIVLFWGVLCWSALTAYLAYQKWPESYGPEFGDFLIRTALFGLTPFALGALYIVGRRSISLSLSRRDAEAKAERVALRNKQHES